MERGQFSRSRVNPTFLIQETPTDVYIKPPPLRGKQGVIIIRRLCNQALNHIIHLQGNCQRPDFCIYKNIKYGAIPRRIGLLQNELGDKRRIGVDIVIARIARIDADLNRQILFEQIPVIVGANFGP